MNLRLILRVLALIAFLSASSAGYSYYARLKAYALEEAERQAVSQVESVSKKLSSFLAQNQRPVKTLAGMQALVEALDVGTADALDSANRILDHFNRTLMADVCYLMNPDGLTVASSNRSAADTFVGKNFSFRPYFAEAINGHASAYLALGVTSAKRGLYHSYPVYRSENRPPVGVVVIKDSIERSEKNLDLSQHDIVLVTDPHGVIFISNRAEWLFRMLWKVPQETIDEVARERQFGKGPWPWIGLTPSGKRYAVDSGGRRYLLHQKPIDDYPGWRVYHLRDVKSISRIVSDPLIKITGPIVLAACALIGVAIFFLYRRASKEILQRRTAEKALRESEKRYRSLYHNTPAMLHSIDPDGTIISVSQYWAEAMGYDMDAVIGRKLTDFLTPASCQYAEQVVFPMFFQQGECHDVPYQFMRRDGEVIDVLLSAISDRDEQGQVVRSLAVSIDVTERKKAEAELRLAKEELSLYSKELERQVRRRTREIRGIFRHTPAVIYMKDSAGRYRMVNSMFEALFQVSNDQVRGQHDEDILPPDVAHQFRSHDQKVLTEKQPFQIEEHIRHGDEDHTYLSVKFPIYGGSGQVSGLCGIATDITALKKAQDQLRRLSGAIMDQQEKERAILARELHDELGQVLTALRMEAVWLRKRLQTVDDQAAGRALTMCELIDKTIDEVRGLAIRLRPGVLDHLGLVDALEWYTADFERRTGIACVFEHNQMPAIDDTVATAAYRIAQEALTNVARHAGASRVDVALKSRNGNLSLSVVDNGCGFKPETLSDSTSLGVVGMQERAALVGGRLDVDARLHCGARVHLTVPLTDV